MNGARDGERPAMRDERSDSSTSRPCDALIDGMPMLTVWQPHASLIADEVKPSETRSWMAPKKYWGTTIGIHAGMHIPTSTEVMWYPQKLLDALWRMLDPSSSQQEPRHNTLRALSLRERLGFLPRGAVIATVTLVECVQVWAISSYGTPFVKTPEGERKGSIDNDGLGDYSVGRWVWLLSDVKKLSEPVPARGHQGLWRWKDG